MEVVMRVSEAMTHGVRVANVDEIIKRTARLMSRLNPRPLPADEDNYLIGMITNRGFAIRAIASGKGLQIKMREVMTANIKYCFADQDLDNMGGLQFCRLPVIDRDKQLTGILSWRDIAVIATGGSAGAALTSNSRTSGAHRQAS
jgi:CBS domain-containing protein